MVDIVTELPGSGGGGGVGSSFSDAYWNVYNEADPTKLIGLDASNNAVGGQATLIMPAGVTTAPYTLALATYGNTFTDVQTFDESGGGSAPILIRSDVMGVGGDFLSVRDETNSFLLSFLGPGAGLSAARSHSIQDASGTYVLVGDSGDPPAANFMGIVNRTAQTADITSTIIANGTGAKLYVVYYVLETTTSAPGAGAITLTLSWTDDAGATTASSAALILTAVGRDRGTIPLYLASGNVTYTVTVAGIYSTSAYALRMRIMMLG